MHRIVLFFLLSAILSLPAFSAEPKKIKILTTIKPISLLVSAIVGERNKITQLIPDYSSPHNYSFKPSDIRKIKQADIVFRIDEHFESFLTKTFDNNTSAEKIISLAEVKGIHLLDMSADHNHSHAQGSHEDLHIWTSPENALAMAEAISNTLIKVDQSNQKQYETNLATFEQQLKTVTQKTKLQLSAVKETPYLVFLNNWRYFSDYFLLSGAHNIRSHEAEKSGIKSLINTRKEIEQLQIRCLFSAPTISRTHVNVLTEGLTIKNEELDILASTSEVTPTAYIKWLGDFGQKIATCIH